MKASGPKQRIKDSKARQGLRIRRANLKDLETLVAQRRAMWKAIGYRDRSKLDSADRDYREWARSRLGKGTLLGWIVDEGSNVAGGGCLWLQPIQPRPGVRNCLQPYLLSMYTGPKFRGRGVASMIVKEAKEWTRRNGYPRLTLHSSDMGRRIYLKQGFKRTWEMKKEFARTS